MGIKTYDEYLSRLKKMKRNLYVDGSKCDRLDERLAGQLRVIKETYDRANDPEWDGLATATSHLTGNKINRFTHIHHSVDDLLNKQQMTRLICHRVGGCIMRCMGIDAMNALSVVTYEMDQALGTDTGQNFLKYLTYWQENDITANCAQTDVKGDRLKRPHEQVDPDLYLRIIESRPDGIVVRGAKIDNTTAPVSDEIIAIPTRFMTDKDNEYAVAFAVPADWEGVKMLVRPAYNHKRKYLQAPIAEVGDAESYTIFDDVFAISPIDPDFIVTAGSHDEIYISYDGGKTWGAPIDLPSYPPPYAAAVLVVAIDKVKGAAELGGVYAGTRYRGLFYKPADSSTFQEAGLNNPAPKMILSIAVSGTSAESKVVWVGTTDGLYRQINSGAFVRVDGGDGIPYGDVEIDPQCSTRVYAAVGFGGDLGSSGLNRQGGVRYSTNGGKTWQWLTDRAVGALGRTSVSSVKVDYTDSRYVYATSSGRGLWRHNWGANLPACE